MTDSGGLLPALSVSVRWLRGRSAPLAKPSAGLGVPVCIAVCDQVGHLVAPG